MIKRTSPRKKSTWTSTAIVDGKRKKSTVHAPLKGVDVDYFPSTENRMASPWTICRDKLDEKNTLAAGVDAPREDMKNFPASILGTFSPPPQGSGGTPGVGVAFFERLVAIPGPPDGLANGVGAMLRPAG